MAPLTDIKYKGSFNAGVGRELEMMMLEYSEPLGHQGKDQLGVLKLDLALK